MSRKAEKYSFAIKQNVRRTWLHAGMQMFSLLFLVQFAAASAIYSLDPQNDIIGSVGTYSIKNDESLYEIARTYKTGYNEITAANPGRDPYIPGKGVKLILPTSWILPGAVRSPGIVINISEMRLYYYFARNGVLFVTEAACTW